ncbi:MAG TPA: S-layer homology domain-containing protein [Candidatus Scatomorpha stercorigallinarum]|nr:S-layer homology domain-containing protein [Candidatus Scatomorpha stercorigallinarum]
MMKRFFASLACVFLFAAALAGSALASSSQRQIIVGGEPLSGSEESPAYATTDASGNVTIGGDENTYNVKWDGETLTLRNAYVINWYEGSVEPYYLGSGIYEEYNTYAINVELVGANAVAGNRYGIYTPNHDLTFSGDGSLAVVSMYNLYDEGAGIRSGAVTVNSGSLTVQSRGLAHGMSVEALNVKDGFVNIAAGRFGVIIRSTSEADSLNISGGELTVTGSSVISRWSGDDGTDFHEIVVNGSQDKTIVVVTRGEFEEDNKNYNISSTVTLDMGNGGGAYPMGHPSYFHSYVKGKLVTDASVSLDEDTLNLVEGDKGTLNATVEPEGTPITWTSSDPVVATVDANGKVTAHNAGTATITARAGTASDTCEVTVSSRPVNIRIVGEDMYGTAEEPVYATTDDDGNVTTTGASEDNYNIKWDGETLTLNNATVIVDEDEAKDKDVYYAIELTEGGNIQIEGVNTVKGPSYSNDPVYGMTSYGIYYSSGRLTIDGSGTLNVSGQSGAIRAFVNATGLTINGGTVNAKSSSSFDSYGHSTNRAIYIDGGGITINGGTVKVTANHSDGAPDGIYAVGDIIINSGVVNAEATGTGTSSYGIYSLGNVVINGGVVTAVGTTAGIHTYGTNVITINPVEVSEIHVMAGKDANSAQSIATITTRTDITDAIENAKYFHSNGFNIYVGGVGLYGASGAPAYAVNDGSGNITTTGADATNYNVMWDGTTLTLNGATISGGISYDGENSINLVMEGENAITASGPTGINIMPAPMGITISGDGALTIVTEFQGIQAYFVNVESGTLKINAKRSGINAVGTGVTIKGGEVEILSAVDAAGQAIYTGDEPVIIEPQEGKNITVKAGESKETALEIGTYNMESEDIQSSLDGCEYFHSYTTDIPTAITSVTVSPPAATVEAGQMQQFTATVSGTGEFSQEVTWSVSGGVSAGTSISANGLLTVAADETATSLTVTATASGDSSKSASVTVTVTPPESVTGVSISPADATVEAGQTVQFSATVSGTGGFSQEVTWSVSGGVSAGTSISADGLLTVAADETATSLTVMATASGDSSKSASVTVTVTPPSTPDEPDVPVWPVFPGGSTGPDETEEPEDEGLPFIDVHEGDWFYENVGYVYENGLMNGVSETLFEPNGTVTRGMIVTILHRLEGEPESDYDMPFTDVAEQQWCAGAVRWAAGEGIVTGVSATEFAPDDPITREQFAAILWRYAQSKGYDVSASADLTGFLDYGQISEYALPALQWAVGAGVMSGRGDGILAPQGTATRAEAAAMLMRFVENVK